MKISLCAALVVLVLPFQAVAEIIFVENDDSVDLFVKILDLNTPDQKIVFDKRLNDDQQVGIDVQLDGSNEAKIQVTATDVNDSTRTKTEIKDRIGAGSIIDIDARQ